MDLGVLVPIVAILGSAWMLSSILKFAENRRRSDTVGNDEALRLKAENDNLHATVNRLEERLRVLERIATDPAERTAREIEQLRD